MARIIDYPEKTSPGSDDYFLLDSSSDGTKKISAGNVATSAISRVETSVLNWNSVNVIATYGNHISKTISGITFTWISDDTVRVSGTATWPAYTDIYFSDNEIPFWIKQGKKYHVKTNAVNVDIKGYKYVDGSLITPAFFSSKNDSEFVLPSDATGLILRLYVSNGTTVDETDTISMWTSLSNGELEEYINRISPIVDVPLARPSQVTNNGVTYSYDSENDNYSVIGTATGLSYRNIYENVAALPDQIKAGNSYLVNIESTDDNIYCQAFIYYYNGETTTSYNVISNKTFLLAIPKNAVGLIFRIRVYEGTTANGTVKYVFSKDTTSAYIYSGKDVPVNYGSMTNISNRYTDCNDVKENCILFVSSTGGVTTLSNYAFAAAGWLKTINLPNTKNNWFFQIAYPFSANSNKIHYRSCNTTGWTAWTPVGNDENGRVVYNVTQNINRDEIANTYNITTSPVITTDTNGWLNAVDTDTETETGKTDMTGAIMSMLNSTGYCHLSSGIFYVSGNIYMPPHSKIEGCGDTTIRLLSSVESGYIIQPSFGCCIDSIKFSGGYGEPANLYTENAESLGSRHGVYIVANADKKTSHAQVTSNNNKVLDCYFENFDGSAIYMANTGGSVAGYLSVVNTNIYYCMVGINIDWYSEYNKFTNMIIRKCNHACINNGGNNVFTNCTFHGVVGFLIDNSGNDKSNNAHGTCSACTFNHINNGNNPSELGMGDGILIKNATNGFIFTGCQIWYGKIIIEDSRGISVSNTLIGGNSPVVTVTGSYPAFFSDCIFHQSPTITATSGTVFDNCRLDTTGELINA